MKRMIVLLTLAAIIAALCASPAWAVSPSVIGGDGYFYLNGSGTKTIIKGVEEERRRLTDAEVNKLIPRLQADGINLIVLYAQNQQSTYFHTQMQAANPKIWIAQHFGTVKKELIPLPGTGGVVGTKPDAALFKTNCDSIKLIVNRLKKYNNILFWWLGGEFVEPEFTTNLLGARDTVIKHIQRYRDTITKYDTQFGTRRPFTVSHHYMEIGSSFANYSAYNDFLWITAVTHIHTCDVGLLGWYPWFSSYGEWPAYGSNNETLLNIKLKEAVSSLNGGKPIFMGGLFGDAPHDLTQYCDSNEQYGRMYSKWESVWDVKHNGYSTYHLDSWNNNKLPHTMYRWNGSDWIPTEAGLALQDIATDRIIITSPGPKDELMPGQTYVAKVVDNAWQTATTNIVKVDFTLGGAVIGTVTVAPWSINFIAPSSAKSVATTLSATATLNTGATVTTSIPVGKISVSYYDRLTLGSTVNVFDPKCGGVMSAKLEEIAIVSGQRQAVLTTTCNLCGSWTTRAFVGQAAKAGTTGLFVYPARIFDGGGLTCADIMIAPYQYPSLDIVYPMNNQQTNICEVRLATNYSGKNVPWTNASQSPGSTENLKDMTFTYNGSSVTQKSEVYIWNMSTGNGALTVKLKDLFGAEVTKTVTVTFNGSVPFYVYRGEFGDSWKSKSLSFGPYGNQSGSYKTIVYYNYWDGSDPYGTHWGGNSGATSRDHEISIIASTMISGPLSTNIPTGSTPVYVVNKNEFTSGTLNDGYWGTISYLEIYDRLAAMLGKDSQGKYRVWVSTSAATRSVNDALTDIDPPTVTITGPSNNAVVAAGYPIDINANAWDQSGIARVEFYVDGVLKGTDYSEPYKCTWTAPAAITYDKDYALTATAYGNDGRSTSTALSPSTVTVQGAVFNPVANGGFETHNGWTTSSDGPSINLKATDGPYEGNNYAKMTRIRGTWGVSRTGIIKQTITVPSNATVLTYAVNYYMYYYPASMDIFFGGVSLEHVSVPMSGGASSGGWQVRSLNISSYRGQTVDFMMRIIDACDISQGFAGLDNVRIETLLPTISISAPASGSSYAVGTIVPITASAGDANGISKVEFFADGTCVGTATASPYTCNWKPMTAKSYAITAKATNVGGAFTFSAPVTVTGTGMVAVWKLNESGGATTTADSTGYGNTGTLVNGPTWVAGKVGNCLSFDGVDDRVTIMDATSLRAVQYTVSVWIKPNGVPNETWKGIIGKSGRNYNIWLNSAGYIHHRFHNSSSTNAGAPDTPAGSITWDTWNHVVITNDGVNAKTYINGVEKASGSSGGNQIVDNTAVIIGKNMDDVGYAGNFYKGLIDEARIYNRALSAAEVATVYSSGWNLIANWRFNETSGTTAADASGNGNTGTLVNGPIWVAGKTGNALSFDGVNDYVNCGNGTGLNIGTVGQSYSVSAWFKTSISKDQSISEKWPSSGGVYPYCLRGPIPDGTIRFAAYDGTNSPKAWAYGSYADNVWHHAVGVRDAAADKIRIYMDGVLKSEVTDNTVGNLQNTASVVVGRRHADVSNCQFNGLLDEVRIYNRALSASEISAMYSAPGSGPQMEIGSGKPAMPLDTKLLSCAPNPTSQYSNISYQLASPANVSLKVYNISGQIVKTLVDENKSAGINSVRWDGRDANGNKVAAGVYLYRMRAEDYSATRKLTVLR